MSTAPALALVSVAGAVLTLAYPQPDIAPLAWVALAPLLAATQGRSVPRGFLLAWVFGLAFYGVLLSWETLLGVISWVPLVLLQSLFVGLFGALWAVTSRLLTSGGGLGHRATRNDALSVAGYVVLAASLWTAVDWLRSYVPLGGFTWGQLAQSQHDLRWLLRPAAWGGAWAVTWLVAALNALVVKMGAAVRRRHTRAAAAAGAAALVVVATPAAIPAPSADGPELEVAIVQGNSPPDFRGSLYAKNILITRSHARLTKRLPSRLDLVVWPESSVNVDPTRDPRSGAPMRSAARALGVPMIVGGNLDVDEGRYKVVAWLVSGVGEIVDTYQKRHLVPFGEYVPARSFFDFIPALEQVPRDAIPGDEATVFEIGASRLAPVISFEADFGRDVRESIAAGGRLLVVATNTSTYGYTWNSAQHVAFSQLRAVENGVWVAHAAISGISAFIAPDGTVRRSTPLWTPEVIMQTVRTAESTTFYTRHGPWVPALSAALSVVAIGWALRARRRRAGREPEAEASLEPAP